MSYAIIKKIRLDELLVKKKFAEDLKKANSLILSGSVLVNEQKVFKAGEKFLSSSNIRILKIIPEYVSRGAYKLKSAIEHFKPNVKNKICLDLGASTGGFTEVLLLENAKKIYAFDVGYGQMASRLQNNPKVILKDRFNVKDLKLTDIEETDFQEIFIVIDLSFISLIPIFQTIKNLKKEKPNLKIEILSLIKPQFEAEKKDNENGIITNPRIHFSVLKKILKFVKSELNGNIFGICNSGIKGKSGNKEFFIYFSF